MTEDIPIPITRDGIRAWLLNLAEELEKIPAYTPHGRSDAALRIAARIRHYLEGADH